MDSLYYLDNFQRVLASLEARYAELLSPEERQFIAHFGVLPQAPRALLVRMVMRRGVFFRRSRLHYTEIGETSSAMASLLDAGWVKVDPALDVKQLERLLTKGELIQHFSLSRQCRKLKKSELVNCLSAQYPDARPFHGWSDAGFRVLCALPRSQTEGDVEKKSVDLRRGCGDGRRAGRQVGVTPLTRRRRARAGARTAPAIERVR